MNELDCEKRLAELDEQGDVARAIELCEELPCSENATCQRYLGWTYLKRGEIDRAVEWYLRAAAQGDSEAIEECWKCVHLIDEKGNKEKAVKLSETEPLRDYLSCQRYLAKYYFEQGDVDKTLTWCLKVAERGGPDDLLYVGRLYLSKNQAHLALPYLKQAASAGNPRAQQLLGEMHAFGLGLPKDIDAASRYYQASAKQGLVLSQVRLLHIQRKQGAMPKFLFFVRLPFIILKGLIIKLRNPKDPRVADIPNLSDRTG